MNILKQYKAIFLLLSITAIFTSCTEPIPADELNIDSSYSKLLVSGSITNETKSHEVYLQKSTNLFDEIEPLPVTKANVSISDGTNIFSLTESEPGKYITAPTVQGVIGKTYTLLIDNVDIDENGKSEQYTAESKMGAISPIDSISLVYTSFSSGAKAWVINLFAFDPPTKDYYLFKAFVNQTLATPKTSDWRYQDDDLFNSGPIANVPIILLFQERKENAYQTVEPGDLITLQMASITEDYYKFISEFASDRSYNPLFSGPPANIQTNISNKAIGFFAAYSVEYAFKTIPPKPWIIIPFYGE